MHGNFQFIFNFVLLVVLKGMYCFHENFRPSILDVYFYVCISAIQKIEAPLFNDLNLHKVLPSETFVVHTHHLDTNWSFKEFFFKGKR